MHVSVPQGKPKKTYNGKYLRNTKFHLSLPQRVHENSITPSISNSLVINSYIVIWCCVSFADYFYLYRISYQWYIVFGLVVTLLVGLLVSWIGERAGLISPSEPHPDLFVPPIARILRRRLERTADVSNFLIFINRSNSSSVDKLASV